MELLSLQNWYALVESPGPPELGEFMDTLLTRTAASITEEAYTRIDQLRRLNPLEERCLVPGPRTGPRRASVIMALIFAMPPADPMATVHQILTEAAAWLNHIWLNPSSPVHLAIRTRMEGQYGLGHARRIYPYDLLLSPRDMTYYALALFASWADLTRRNLAWVPLTFNPPVPMALPSATADSRWVL